MIRVHRSDKVFGDRLIQNFSNKVKSSRLINLLKDRQYFKRKPTKRYQRMAAIMRDYYRAKRERERFYN